MKSVGGDSPEPQRGDVVSIESGEPDHGDHSSGPLGIGPPPEPDSRVRIRLHDFPFTFVVRVSTDKRTGPQVAELTIAADDGQAVDYAAIRAVPVRRLAHSAAQWIARWGGQVGFVGDVAETFSQPDNPAPKVYEAAKLANNALALGLPVRPYVAQQLIVSKTTVDRLLKRARAEGWLDDEPLPKRPQPQQRDDKTNQENGP
ncbi:hypothetical protein [Mycobacterium sp. IDR2000157661]|uniref:hypothetical protein n=1 Tax=Mycobacterium sp. IDR2000157661 TaxID=2867005 RepID=UPI001EEB62F4|nr:hypothetical protein [Mycobacterium sp. IDR2000157661]ULE33350.1 hypothetical protein K3G64_01070 [Mycobacterium sp. IDR2000157661]